MTAELTAEEIVTKLLSSNEVLKNKENIYLSNPIDNLGDFLVNTQNEIDPQLAKYSFIRAKWEF